jgi:uncharacterized alkaline shock family protein YloU
MEQQDEKRSLLPETVNESLDSGKEQSLSVEGTTIIEDEVVASIAGFAASSVEGVEELGKGSVVGSVTKLVKSTEDSLRKGIDVEVGKKEAIINIQMGVVYGYHIPDIVDKVRKKVASALLDSTGLVAREINIRIVSIKFTDTKKKTG